MLSNPRLLSVPEEGYSRHALYTLNLIFTFLFSLMNCYVEVTTIPILVHVRKRHLWMWSYRIEFSTTFASTSSWYNWNIVGSGVKHHSLQVLVSITSIVQPSKHDVWLKKKPYTCCKVHHWYIKCRPFFCWGSTIQ